MKFISNWRNSALQWLFDHVAFTKMGIMLLHIFGTAIFWTIFDTAVGLSVFVFSWLMLVCGQLWMALPEGSERIVFPKMEVTNHGPGGSGGSSNEGVVLRVMPSGGTALPEIKPGEEHVERTHPGGGT